MNIHFEPGMVWHGRLGGHAVSTRLHILTPRRGGVQCPGADCPWYCGARLMPSLATSAGLSAKRLAPRLAGSFQDRTAVPAAEESGGLRRGRAEQQTGSLATSPAVEVEDRVSAVATGYGAFSASRLRSRPSIPSIEAGPSIRKVASSFSSSDPARLAAAIYSTLTRDVPLWRKSSASAVLLETSMMRLAANGPRSLTRTISE